MTRRPAPMGEYEERRNARIRQLMLPEKGIVQVISTGVRFRLTGDLTTALHPGSELVARMGWPRCC